MCQIGKLEDNSKKKAKTICPEDIMQMLKDFGIEIDPVSERLFATYASLPIVDDYPDPNDRLIICSGHIRPRAPCQLG